MRLFSIILFLVVFCTEYSSGQRNCYSHEYLLQEIQQDPTRKDRLDQIEEFTRSYLRKSHTPRSIITIPVVVHVVYKTGAENISDAQIYSQIDILNEDFRRQNADASNTPTIFQSVAADIEIEFCLASVTPNGATTSGITRTQTYISSFGTNNSVKFSGAGGVDAWPSDQYLNIWVCNIGGGILGYAQFPGGNPSTDGVVNDFRYFGDIGTATAPFNLGRTLTHEVGHWLNLYHIWGDGNCSEDDNVTDTPLASGSNRTGSPCTFPGRNSCNQGAGDLPDMFQNYMDYSDDVCMNLFTLGQKARMQALFDPGGARVSLLSSNGCGIGNPATCNDEYQNGLETGIDCGGPSCPPCPTCDDGIMNGLETDIDCGGPFCPSCPCLETENELIVALTFDNYPNESSWQIRDESDQIIASGGPYSGQPGLSELEVNLCIADGCYEFRMYDVYGDGMCCFYGPGNYELSDLNGNILASGDQFGHLESTNFCVPVACNKNVVTTLASGTGSITEAIQCANENETILLSSSLANQTIDLGNIGLLIDKSLTIEANPADQIKLTSSGSDPTIRLSPAVSLTLIGFEVMSTSADQPTIENYGTLILDNMYIKNSMGNPQLMNTMGSNVMVSNSSTLRK